jgi:hypothetical protein
VIDEDGDGDELSERKEEIRIGKKRQVVGILVCPVFDFFPGFPYGLCLGPATGYHDPFSRHRFDFGYYDRERIQ